MSSLLAVFPFLFLSSNTARNCWNKSVPVIVTACNSKSLPLVRGETLTQLSDLDTLLEYLLCHKLS